MSYVFEYEEYEGLMYTSYMRYGFFKERANKIMELYPDKSTTILIAGCGYGYLIDELINLGYRNVVGIDDSNYALSKCVLPSRVVKGNILKQTDLQNCRVLVGLKGKQKFDICVTEDVLPCCFNEDEVHLMIQNLREISNSLFHIITCGEQSDDFRNPLLLWKSNQYWKEIVKDDLILDVETGVVI